jgi:Tfp pilus assembly protein PilV
MTLIEVMIAITILTTAALSLAAFMGKFARAIAVSDVKTTAIRLASDRLEQVKTAPRYATIDSMYTGVETLPAPYDAYSRQTIISHSGGGDADLYDYKTITVVVKISRLSVPIKRTTIIAAF